MFVGLSLDQAPPFEAPLKFFLTAPLFAVLAGGLFLFQPFENFAGVLHLLTIGFMISVIIGALQQMLPVVAGAVLPRPVLLANITYMSLLVGLGSFVGGFEFGGNDWFWVSGVFLLFGLGSFFLIALYKLLLTPKKNSIVKGMILSLIFFVIGLVLGEFLLFSYDIFKHLHYHILFFGFLFLLIASISFQVVPMFWVAESYTQKEQMLILLGVPTGIFLFPFPLLNKLILTFVGVYFATLTLKKLLYRKRKLKDISVYFYIASMIWLVVGFLYWLGMEIFDFPPLSLGIFWGLGFVFGVIYGMLYKIVPFLTWFHLSNQGIFSIPTMREMIGMKKGEIHLLGYLFMVSFLGAGIIFSNSYLLTYGGIFFVFINGFFFFNLLGVAQIYWKNRTP